MKININDAIKTPTRRLGYGIHNNLSIGTKGYQTSPNGNEYVAFEFEGEDGSYVLTEWVEVKATPNPGETQEAADMRELTKKTKRMLEILKTLLPMEEIVTLGSITFKVLLDKLIAAVKKNNKKVSLKLIYDYKGAYVEAPKYNNAYGWITSDPNVSLKFTDWELANRSKPVAAPASNEAVLNPGDVL